MLLRLERLLIIGMATALVFVAVLRIEGTLRPDYNPTYQMKESRVFKVILIVLALTLVIFGGWRLVDPIGFYTFSGLDLPDDAGLLSEVRGAGGIIMVSGLVVGLGVLRHAWSRTSVVLAAMVFLSMGLARLLRIALDGSPGAEVIQGMAIELVFGGLALFAFVKYREADA